MFLIMVVAVTKSKGNENNQNKINNNKNNKKCDENKKFHMNKNIRIFRVHNKCEFKISN